MSRQFTDASLDRMIREALNREGKRLAFAQPAADEAIGRLAGRLGTPSSFLAGSGRRATTLVWVVVVVLVALAAVVVGAQLLRQTDPRPLIVAQPFGPGMPCETDLDDEVVLQFSLGNRVLTIKDSGLVRLVDQGEEAFGMRWRGVLDDVADRQLSPAGLELVREQLAALDLPTGCRDVRTFEIGGSLLARTAGGLIDLQWSSIVGDRSVAPLPPPGVAESLESLEAMLGDLDAWLPAGALMPAQPPAPTHWIVHVIFVPTDYGPDAVVNYPGDVVVTAGDGRFESVELPGGDTLDTFGAALPGEAPGRPNSTQRCGIITTSEAGRLADSLDRVALPLELGEPAMFTPDLGAGVYVGLVPAIDDAADCRTFAAQEGGAVRPKTTATPEGDLAALDPCSLVPDSLRGPVERSYPVAPVPLGVAARSCLLTETQNMGTLLTRQVLWVYPSSMSRADAEVLIGSVFGGEAVAEQLDGQPAWLNHCLATETACAGGMAAWRDGLLLLVEVVDRRARGDGRATTARQILSAAFEELD